MEMRTGKSVRISVTVSEDQKRFLEKEGLSPSKLLQQKIEEKMRERGYMDIAVTK